MSLSNKFSSFSPCRSSYSLSLEQIIHTLKRQVGRLGKENVHRWDDHDIENSKDNVRSPSYILGEAGVNSTTAKLIIQNPSEAAAARQARSRRVQISEA